METNTTEQNYLHILQKQLIVAQGCTEPISIAYGSALARKHLGRMPESFQILCSKNFVKNVKSVMVPNAEGMRGIDVAVLLGALAGDADRMLEVLTPVRPEHVAEARKLLAAGVCRVGLLDTPANLHFVLTVRAGEHVVEVEIYEEHTNVVRLTRDGELLIYRDRQAPGDMTEYDVLSVAGIVDFAETVNLDLVGPLLQQQIDCNSRIAAEGLRGDYGANVGRTLLQSCRDCVECRAKAYAAAGSDARMSGCELPVVINSGSGNQGLTVSLPVIQFAGEIGADRDRLYRALIISNLVAIHQKSKIGWLSAYCGAVTAAGGCAAAFTYLSGGGLKAIEQSITNVLANVSGIVCDGAKPSCAAKIASAVDAAFLGHHLTCAHHGFGAGEGIVKDELEKTIAAVGVLANRGMRQTDDEILNIMLNDEPNGRNPSCPK